MLLLKLNLKNYKLKWHFFQGKTELLYGVMEKTLSLLQMGFTEEEVSSAIDNFDQRATVQELADSILARRIANSIEQKEVTD